MRNRLGNAWWITVVVQLLVAAAIILIILPMVVDESFAKQAGDQIWIQRNRNAARQLIPYLAATLKLGVSGAILLPVICTICWFAYLVAKRVEAPGEAKRAFAVWIGLMSIGTVACVAFGGILLQSSYFQQLFNADLSDIFYRINPAARAALGGGILFYFLASYFIGTLISTPSLFRPAVPLASRFSIA
jgi:hypothetical protein